MSSQSLRPYQAQSIEALRAGFRDGHRRQVLLLPTGAGKTTVAAKIIEATLKAGPATPNAVLFQAHRTELIDQCSERLDQNGLKAHGVIMAGHPRRRPHAPIQIASVDTLANRKPLDPPPRLIVADECHRVLGARQLRIVTELYPEAFVIGLTATPWRLDGRGLGMTPKGGEPTLFTRMVAGATYADLIASGYILDPLICCPWSPDLSAVGVNSDGEFDADQIADLVDQPQTIRDIVESWLERSGRARTVAFAASIEHSHHLVKAFQAAGVRAAHVDGETDPTERRETLAKLARHEIDVVSNFNVLGEGWDCPAVEVCILGRPTASLSLYMQCVGRVLRPSAGKSRALVLDYAGAVMRHGWPTADRNWTLDDRPKRKKSDVDPDEEPMVSQCPQCLFARPSFMGSKPCAQCGYVMPGKAPPPIDLETKSGVPLVEVSRDAVEAASTAGGPRPMAPGRRGFSAPPTFNARPFAPRTFRS